MEAPSEVRICARCRNTFTGHFCNQCGLGVAEVPGRPTLRGLLRELAADLTSVDRGLWPTLRDLALRPGRVVEAYLAGNAPRYLGPTRYLLLAVAVTTFAYLQLHLGEGQVRELTTSVDPATARQVRAVSQIYLRFVNVFTLLAVPFLVAMSRLVFRRAGRSLAEHAIFNMYLYAQSSLVFLLILPLVLYEGGLGVLSTTAYYGVVVTYYAWACVGFFPGRSRPTILRAVAVNLLAYGTYFLLVGFAAAVWAVLHLR